MASIEEAISAQKSAWNAFAAGWNKWESFIRSFMGAVSEVMLEKVSLKSGDRVLDAATGAGEPGLTVAKLVAGGEVVGTDVAERMVAFANENAAKQGVANYRAVAAATSDLPFEDGAFDAAVCRFGVIFSPDVLADVKELARVVKDGGKISASAWAAAAKNPWATLIPDILGGFIEMPAPAPEAPGLWRCAAPNALAAIMTEAGLKDVDSVDVPGEFIAESPEQYWEIMTEIAAPITGALSRVDDATREEVRQKTLAALREKYMRDDRVVLPLSAWVVTGTK